MSLAERGKTERTEQKQFTRDHVCQWGIDCTNWHAIEELRKYLQKIGYGKKGAVTR